MTGASVDFRGEIRRYADEKNLDLGPDRIEAINAVLQTFSVPDVEAGTITYRWPNGAAATLAGILAAETATAPRRATSQRPDGDFTGMTATQRAVAINKGRNTVAAKAADAEALVSRFGNPWLTGNRTHQAFLTRGNPTLAAELRRQAGA